MKGNLMRYPSRIFAVLTATVASLALATGPAIAGGNPHFIKPSVSLSGVNLTVTFKEAGLASGSVETVQASASYTAIFQCVNGGGKNPSAANKSEESGDATASGSFAADKNGNISGSLTITAPTVNTNALVCPGGQKEQLSQLTWSGIELNDLTSGASATFPNTYSAGSGVI
jgi:hypothetical protein